MSNELITAARAKLAINQSSFTTPESHLIDELVKGASEGVRRYCGRDFRATDYDELYSGTGTRALFLRHYPVLAVSRVATAPTAVLKVINTSSANQRATVAVSDIGLTLVRVASGVVTTDISVTFATYPTVATVRTAINSLGNGWAAVVPDSTFADWASADLTAIQGALNAKNIKRVSPIPFPSPLPC